MRDPSIHKTLLIGSGPIVIGQAAEFDYAGTQALRVLREEGVESVLLNPNPATIMTDRNVADHVYIEPITVKTAERILQIERPDSILASMGGQAGLNLAVALEEAGILKKYGVRLLGVHTDSIKRAEDRALFKETMEKLRQPVPQSGIVHELEEGLSVAAEIGYPLVLRPAFTLGGTGGGIAEDPGSCREILERGLRLSPRSEVLVEKSIAGWKEIEFEVMRDLSGNAITVTAMENLDPVGIHTGDSIVVVPPQTLTDREYQMLRSAALSIIGELGIVGGCNVQFALDPNSFSYYVIEVNPRVSRSSALASKAAGYPIARVSTKLALGYRLDEIRNLVTGKTTACFEPVLDYCVVKIPRLPFDKFRTAVRHLGTQMKATGEVMAIGRNFESALMKALRSLDLNIQSLLSPDFSDLTDRELLADLREPDDRRIFLLAEALKRGISISDLSKITAVNAWFLSRLDSLVKMELRLREEAPTEKLLWESKILGFPDQVLSSCFGMTENQLFSLRKAYGISAAFQMVDTCASEFDAETPYFYGSYGLENEAAPENGSRKKVLILGSGPIRIGQGIEFDYCSVRAVLAFRRKGFFTIIINNNPETVSTDFDTADRLYFEPLTAEDVRSVVEIEKPDFAVAEFGGQTAISLISALKDMAVPILGTAPEDVDAAEDRALFDEILEKTGIRRPEGRTVLSAERAVKEAKALGFPVLVRPSYVLGGQGMRIALNEREVLDYVTALGPTSRAHPILIDRYVPGRELEVDAVSDGSDVVIPGIMEQIERAGIHSGDSISVYPARDISEHVREEIVKDTIALSRALHVKGLINIQFIADGETVYVIEVNPRSSRTVPFLSKVSGIPIVDLAVHVLSGLRLRDMGFLSGLQADSGFSAVKMPVFSFEKLDGADISLGPEMKSTGEVLGISREFHEALGKAFLGAGILPEKRNCVISVRDEDKEEILPIARNLQALGYRIFATRGTSRALLDAGIPNFQIRTASQEPPNVLDLCLGHQLDLFIDTPKSEASALTDGFRIRRAAIESGVTVITALDTARALLDVLSRGSFEGAEPVDLSEIPDRI